MHGDAPRVHARIAHTRRRPAYACAGRRPSITMIGQQPRAQDRHGHHTQSGPTPGRAPGAHCAGVQRSKGRQATARTLAAHLIAYI